MSDSKIRVTKNIDKLVQRGERQGYLTALEIFAVLSPDLVDDLDDLLGRLQRHGVAVVDTQEEGAKIIKERRSRSGDEGNAKDALSSYLREINGVPSLDRDAEIRCAKEFRSGIGQALRSVADTRYFVEQILLRASWIRRGRLPIWDVIVRPSNQDDEDPGLGEESFLRELAQIARQQQLEKRTLQQLERHGISDAKARSLSARLKAIRADRLSRISAIPFTQKFLNEITGELMRVHHSLAELQGQRQQLAGQVGAASGSSPSTQHQRKAGSVDPEQSKNVQRLLRNLRRKIKRQEAQAGMSSEALMAMARRYQTGMLRAQRARDALILSAQRLVLSSARYYGRRLGGSGMEISDLISEGNKGLIRAVELFDPQRGNRFSTFAGYWVRHQMIRAIHTQSRTVYVPPHIRQQMSKILATENDLLQRSGHMPTDEELASASDMDVPSLRHTMQSFGRVSSIDRPLDPEDSGSGSYVDILADERATPEVELEGAQRREMVRALAQQLQGRERAIVFLRMGWENDDPKTLAEIGEEFGISRQRVEQLEKRALAKLRRWARSQGLEDPLK